VLGTLIAVVNDKKIKVLYQITQVFISIVRGTPVLLQIYIIYHLLPLWLGSVVDAAGWNVNVYRWNSKVWAIIALSLSTTVILSEVIRSGLISVGEGQKEAAYSVGLNGAQTFWKITAPQTLAAILPVLSNSFIDLIKTSSLAFVMSVMEVTGRSKVLGGSALRYFEAYLSTAFVYIILIVIVEVITKCIERATTRYRAHA
jgi:His/Glu/Gln/Arg/opine family amino acid ABC transporter permease subunit